VKQVAENQIEKTERRPLQKSPLPYQKRSNM